MTHVNDAATRPLQIRAGSLEDGRADVRRLSWLCELSEEEIRAISEHEHIPEIIALELGNYLIRRPEGDLLVSHMFIDDIRAAEGRGDLIHAAQLKKALRHFIEEHFAQSRSAPDR